MVGSSLEQLEEHDDVTIQWHAFELHPADAPPLSPESQARILAGRPLLQQSAREHYGLEMNPGPLDTNSRPALVLEKYAQTQSKHHRVALARRTLVARGRYTSRSRSAGSPSGLVESVWLTK
ncbi:MAG TPA: hypothetical protein VF043_16380 [Ktedonobacteraceae bacterium]